MDSITIAPGGGAAALSCALFLENAPGHWAAGLPVIPLREGQKRPAIDAWSVYCRRTPTAEEQARWLRQFPGGNLGLPLGPAAGVDVADVDTENPAFRRAIEGVLPPSPWRRIGKKGFALEFRHSGIRPFKIKGGDGGMLFEFLSTGNQVVLPPSIHPETKAPYVSDTNLWEREVLEALEPLPLDVEGLLRAALAEAGADLAGGSTGRSC